MILKTYYKHTLIKVLGNNEIQPSRLVKEIYKKTLQILKLLSLTVKTETPWS